jgi:heme exporter protein B
MSIFLASPSLILISLVASLFSIQLKSNKILQFIIIFPFYIPIIIFTTSIGHNQDKLYDNNFLILIGIFFITLPISLLTSRLIMREINR